MKKHKLIVLTILLIATGGILTACGSNNASKDNKPQTLNLAASSRLDTIDISKSGGYGSTVNVFESFYRLGKKGSITPGLAEKVLVVRMVKHGPLNLEKLNLATVVRLLPMTLFIHGNEVLHLALKPNMLIYLML